MFVWVDETGTNHKGNIHKFGYSLQGIIFTGATVSGDTFYDFVRGSLISMMLPLNGVNERSVVVKDKSFIYHI